MSHLKRYTRRQFLGVAGLGTLAGSIMCAAGIASYLLLREPNAVGGTRRGIPTPSPTGGLKQIARPPVITRAQWNARPPNPDAANENGTYSLANVEGWREYDAPLRDVYRTVVVHHSVEYDANDLDTIQHVQDLHMDDRGWADIAYHFVVGKSGQVFEGRALDVRGTHVSGYNTGSVGVVFLGNLHETQPMPEQLDQGRQLIDWLALRLELTHIAGHTDFNPESVCPGQYMLPYLDMFAMSAGLIVGTSGYDPPREQRITPTPVPGI